MLETVLGDKSFLQPQCDFRKDLDTTSCQGKYKDEGPQLEQCAAQLCTQYAVE